MGGLCRGEWPLDAWVQQGLSSREDGRRVRLGRNSRGEYSSDLFVINPLQIRCPEFERGRGAALSSSKGACNHRSRPGSVTAVCKDENLHVLAETLLS